MAEFSGFRWLTGETDDSIVNYPDRCGPSRRKPRRNHWPLTFSAMTIRAQLIAPLLLGLAVAACSPSVEDLSQRAEEAISQHRFNEARLHLGSALAERPDDPHLLDMMARLQLQLGDGVAAAGLLDRLAATGADVPDMPQLRAEAALLQGQFDQALALVRDGSTAEAHRVRALALIGKGDLAGAEAAFAAGENASGDASRLLSDFALLRLQQGRLDDAKSLADRALRVAPEGLDALVASARVAQARRQVDRALDLFTRANTLWPDSAAPLLGRIGLLGDLGRLAEARPLIERAAASLPGNEDVIYLQARLAADDGDWTRTRDLLQQLESSRKVGVQLLYARSLLELGLHEQARSRLSPVMRTMPGNPAVRRMMARAMIGSREAAAAMALLEPMARSVFATPEDLALYAEAARMAGRSDALAAALRDIPPAQRIAAQVAQGDAALREGKWRTAIEAYERLRAWTGDSNVLVLNNLAYARGRAGETGEAILLARKAQGLAPDNAAVLDTLGWLLWESGEDREEGLALLRRAAQTAPDDASIRDHLRRAQAG